MPDDPVVLKRMLAELLEALHRRDRDLEQVRHQLDQLLRRLYGPRAERFDPNQPLLFAAPPEAAAAAMTQATVVEDEDATASKRRGHGRTA